MASHPTFAVNVMQMMGDRLQEAHARIKELSTEEVEHRVAHTILRLVTQSGRQTEEGVLVDFPITQQDLAEASGTTLHSVSRVLGAWESTGLVTIGRRKIVVRDVKAFPSLPSGPQEAARSKTARAEKRRLALRQQRFHAVVVISRLGNVLARETTSMQRSPGRIGAATGP